MKTNKGFGFINWFLPLFYILAQYEFIVSSVGIIIIIFASVTDFIKNKKIKIHKWMAYFIGYCTVVQLLFHTANNFTQVAFNNLLMPILMLFVISVFWGEINENKLYSAYSVIGIIVICGILIQSVNFYFFDNPSLPITILPVSSANAHYWGNFYGGRPSSFFAEPQAFASYLAPLLFLALKRERILFALFISFSVLLSTSSQGVVIVAFMWIGYVFLHAKGLLRKFMTTLLVAGIVFLFVTSSLFEFSVKKIASIDIRNNIRLTRGFEIFQTFDIKNQLFGVGIGNSTDYVITHWNKFDWSYGYLQANKEYLLGYSTGISGTIISYGFFAGMLLFMMFYNMARFFDRNYILFLIFIIITFFTQNMLFNAWFIFYFLFYLGISKNTTNVNNSIINIGSNSCKISNQQSPIIIFSNKNL
jgi:hypothetical protein